MKSTSSARRIAGVVVLNALLSASLWAQTPAPNSTSTTQDLIQDGKNGAAFGKQLQQSAPQPTVKPDGTTIVLPSGTTTTVERFAPGYDKNKVEELKRTDTTTEEKLDAAGREAAARLEKEQSSAGEAYRAVREQAQRARSNVGDKPDQDRDLQTTATQLREDSMTSFASQFTGCTSTVNFFKGSAETNRIQHTKTCEHIAPLDTQCTITRNIDVQNFSGTRSDFPVYQVIADRDETFSFPIQDDPDAVLVRADFQLSWSGTVADVQLTVVPDRSNQWMGTVHVVKSTGTICRTSQGVVCAAGDAGCTCDAAPVSQWAQVSVIGDVVLAKQTRTVSPAGCLEGSDGFCSAKWNCDDVGDRDVNGVWVDSNFASNFPTIYPIDNANTPPDSNNPVCWAAHATYDCPFNLGDLCWQSPDGTQHCDTNTQDNTTTNTCAALQNNPDCQLVRSDCAQDATGFGNHCYVSTDTYQCLEQVTGDTWISQRKYDCNGPVRCMGSECVDTRGESNGGFGRALAGMTFAQHLTSDQKYNDTGTAVEVLAGKPYTCHKTLGGLTDCCIETDTGGFTEWNHLYSAQIRQGQAEKKIQTEPDQEKGSWSRLNQPGGATSQRLRENYTSTKENVTGDTGSYGGTEAGIGSSTEIQPATDVYEQRAKENSSTYEQWQCTDPEFELASQRELGNCLYIGSYCKRRVGIIGTCIEKRDSYCCFASPMSRMIREQLIGGAQNAQNGMFGTPENPQCGGVPPSLLADAKLSEAMISEWKARNDEAGTTPTPENPEAFDWNALTGSGSELGPTSRIDAPTRNVQRVASTDNYKASQSIQAEMQAAVPGAVADPTTAGSVSLAPAFYSVNRPGPVQIKVTRIGKVGAASVNYTVTDNTARNGIHYQATSGTLRWNDGESGTKTFPVVIKTFGVQYSNVLQARVTLSNPTGGVTIAPDATGEIEMSKPH